MNFLLQTRLLHTYLTWTYSEKSCNKLWQN